MNKSWIITGSLLIMLSIMLGAFGSHWLTEAWHSERGPVIWDVGTRYQMYMGLGTLLLASHVHHLRSARWIYGLIVSGTVCFCFSLYVLALSDWTTLRSVAGPITPLGGLMLIAAWALVIRDVVRLRSEGAR